MVWISGFGISGCRGTFCACEGQSPQIATATVSLAQTRIASILMPNSQAGQVTVVLERRIQGAGCIRGTSSDATAFQSGEMAALASADAVASSAGGLAPLITSHSIRAISLKKAGWEMVNTLPSYCGHSTPVKLKLT